VIAIDMERTVLDRLVKFQGRTTTSASRPYDPGVLCPELVGRDGEVGRLQRRLDALAQGRGGVVALVGEAGAGKSRLLRGVGEVAAATDRMVLSGRAVPGASPTPYRPLTEALLGAFRTMPAPNDPSLAGFEGHLGRLVPTWSGPGAAEESPVLLAEALVRLLSLVARDRGAVLQLEDVHWADPETLAVIDYLADALREEPVLCVCTARPSGAAVDILTRLDRREADAVVRVGPLGPTGVLQMVTACLAVTDPPAGLCEFVLTHSDGNPFLVEELLAGLAATGDLRQEGGHWLIDGPLRPSVPADLRASIRERLAGLDAPARRVIGAAALLGRSFAWELLPGIAEVDGRAAADALRSAADEQLIEVEGEGFVFRHALTREAVLADLLPPERRELAGRAWPAVERANPGLPGGTLELVADLAEAAGAPTATAEHLVESARRAIVAGAFASAETAARRASRLAADETVARRADEALVHALAAAGKPDEALRLGRALAARLSAAGVLAEEQLDLLLAIVRAGLAAGDRTAAGDAAAMASAATGVAGDPTVRARVDALVAEVALDRGDVAAAEELSRRAVRDARETEQPDVACEALLVLGRVLRPKAMDEAMLAFGEASALAASSQLPRWHLRAQQELAIESWLEEGPGPLLDTRAVAVRYGAHLTVAVMDLTLADLAFGDFDAAATRRHARACAEASRRFGLATGPVAELWLAGGHALAGNEVAMQAAIDAALAPDPDDPRILGDLYGRVLATRAFVRDDLGSLRPILDTMIEHVRRAPPTTSVFPGRIPWALLRTIDDDDLGAPARAEFTEATAAYGIPIMTLAGEAMEAVALGRTGAVDAAAERFERAHAGLVAQPLNLGVVHASVVLAAGAAIRDGWGEPARWLRPAEAFFVDLRLDRLARRCRALLAEAGAPVPRRRGATEVPQGLRAMGVTGREVDVLKLVVEGRSNKEIAAALVLSPKTVERHLSSLFDRLGVGNRHELAEAGDAQLR
jgi:DNA-binding CsgD family transcriptional regulator